jgi:hypothetical protein
MVAFVIHDFLDYFFIELLRRRGILLDLRMEKGPVLKV